MKVASVTFKRQDLEAIRTKGLYEKLESWLFQCTNRKVQLAVFPALIGLLSEPCSRFIEDIRRLSRKFPNLAVCPGSHWEENEGHTYHTACLLKNGEVLLKQRQIYLAKWERAKGLERGVEVKTIEYQGFKLGILLSTDVFYPQVSRYIALAGVDLVLSPNAIKVEKILPSMHQRFAHQFAGVWQNVQQNLFFAIESGFKGVVKGISFYSKSFIHAPLEMTMKNDGFLAKEELEGELLVADLDLTEKKIAQDRFNPLAQLNPNFYKKYLKK